LKQGALVKQYEFKLRISNEAHLRLSEVHGPDEKLTTEKKPYSSAGHAAIALRMISVQVAIKSVATILIKLIKPIAIDVR